MELMNCPNLAVPKDVMHHVVSIESSYNPYAIGVVGGRLARQPKTLPEALATVRMLEGRGFNFSLGLAQVNRYNLAKYGLESYERAFQVCPNLQAGSRILAECHGRAGSDWGKAFSCYYSGNFVTGYRHGYVQKVLASMRAASVPAAAEFSPAIEVIGKPSRRTAVVTRFPLFGGKALQRTTQSLEEPASRATAQVAPVVPASAPTEAAPELVRNISDQVQVVGAAVAPVPAGVSEIGTADVAFVF